MRTQESHSSSFGVMSQRLAPTTTLPHCSTAGCGVSTHNWTHPVQQVSLLLCCHLFWRLVHYQGHCLLLWQLAQVFPPSFQAAAEVAQVAVTELRLPSEQHGPLVMTSQRPSQYASDDIPELFADMDRSAAQVRSMHNTLKNNKCSVSVLLISNA